MSVYHKPSNIGDIRRRKAQAAAAQSAAAIVFVALAEAGETFDDITLGEHSALFEAWAVAASYTKGQVRLYKDKLYRCLQNHTSQDDWTPDAAVSLWVSVSDPAEEWPAWGQPIGAQDAYAEGDKVTHGGKRWASVCSANVWEPGVYGWEEVK